MFRQLGLDDYTDVNVQVLGAEDTYGPHAVITVGSDLLFMVVVLHLSLTLPE